MAQVQKKFGAFSGVFTPSLLTILGVIMYMRLGWVVGEAGLIAALAIIAIAHVISFTTGLSVSSIATDKKIKAGGIYYILSRSLGLPMGGTIGIALFVGTALSISMYIIGFVENFLSIKEISDFLGMTPGVESYRIVGSIVLLVLTVIAFISTSLAIKTQYIILSAIVLSLVSIFAGFFINVQFHPVAPLFSPAGDNVSFEYVFSIFFPAVTGFTAGVAMSGDLKNPKKDIPLGTIAAITVGFVVYILLATGFGFYVKRELLLEDFNIAMKIAWYSPFVVAGVWGATLSSALGGILGGPRILQAISNDGITPKFFGKGYGINNEPRNALLFIALIAEGGILIGNLNAIAGIVTMFYLTSYGFINLAYVLESWASTDFRPSFKIPRGVAITGFVFAFAIMFRIDVLSMILAFILMGMLFVILQRRQMKLEYGDVWQSVWINVIRKGLQKINTKDFEERNWQPNIILFSGGTSKRPHLIEFGKALVGKFGILTNFDLVESKDATVLFPKHKQKMVDKELLKQGVFMRRQSCGDIYEGIEMIVRTYGFAGLEPNTVIMGWGRQSRNPERFVKLINTINELDYNLVLIDYDKRYGYGKKQVIDIWWRGGGNNGNLALALAKFMVNSEDWYGAKIRLLIVNYENDKASYIYRKVDSILENLRINAEIKIINNEIERKPVYDIIRQESFNSDLVFVGIPEIEKGKEREFVERTNKLLHDIGTVVLVRASSLFKELNLGINAGQDSALLPGLKLEPKASKKKETTIKMPANVADSKAFEKFAVELESIREGELSALVAKLSGEYAGLLQELNSVIASYYKSATTVLNKAQDPKTITAALIGLHKKLAQDAVKLIDKQISMIEEDEEFFEKIAAGLLDTAKVVVSKLPDSVKVRITPDDLNKIKKSGRKKLVSPLSVRLTSKKVDGAYEYKMNTASVLKKNRWLIYDLMYGLVETVMKKSVVYLLEVQKSVKEAEVELSKIRNKLYAGEKVDKIDFAAEKHITSEDIENDILEAVYDKLNEFTAELFSFTADAKAAGEKELVSLLQSFPSVYVRNILVFANGAKVELLLAYADAAYGHNMKLLLNDAKSEVFDKLFAVKEALINELKKAAGTGKFEYSPQLDYESFVALIDGYVDNIKNKIKKITAVFPKEVEVLDFETYNSFFDKILSDVDIVNVKIETITGYLFEEKTYPDLSKFSSLLKSLYKSAADREKEVYRLMMFSLENNEGDDAVSKLTEKEIKRLEELDIKGNYAAAESLIFDNITSVSSRLTLYSLLKTAKEFKAYVKRIEREKKTSRIKEAIKSRESFLIRQYVKLKYGKAFILDSSARSASEQGYASAFLKEAARLKPDESIVKKLPFYYVRIFSSSQVVYNEFYAGRKEELERGTAAIDFYKKGYAGALVITGRRGDGKSMLASMLAAEYTAKQNIFTITPPSGGSTSVQDFRRAFFDVFKDKDALEGHDFLHSLNDKIAIVLEDLEKWWLHSPDGNGVVEEIIKMIRTFGKKILFLVTCSADAYSLIGKVTDFDTVVLDNILLSPLKPEELKELIHLRHDTTGLIYRYGNKLQGELSITKEADIFVKLYSLSAGIPGSALYYWLTSVKGYSGEIIDLELPQRPQYSLFEGLSKDSLFVLSNLILHKGLTIERLVSVTGFTVDVLKELMEYLNMNSLVSEVSGVYDIEPCWRVHVYNYLKSKKMI